MRLFCAAMLALSIGLYATYDQFVKGAAPEDQAEKLKAQKKKFGEEFDDLLKRFEKAATLADKKGIQAEARELATLTTEKVLKIAEADPKSETAFEAASFTMSRLVSIGATGPDVDKILGIVSEHHLNNPKVKDLLLTAGRAGPAGEKFLQTAGEKSPDKSATLASTGRRSRFIVASMRCSAVQPLAASSASCRSWRRSMSPSCAAAW